MDMEQAVLQRMQAILEELQAMKPLPEPGSPEAVNDHDGWMKLRSAIKEAVSHAALTAEWVLPVAVRQRLEEIRTRETELLLPGLAERAKQKKEGQS